MIKTKKQKAQKSAIKGKLKVQDYRNCLEAAQIENKITHFENNEIQADSLKEDQKKCSK